uniref:U8-Sparatoxin-Hju1a_1 n=1 Tax=Heteropoda jugulans TaxID=1358901 RepID=A0A4Q8K5U7_9ARAC
MKFVFSVVLVTVTLLVVVCAEASEVENDVPNIFEEARKQCAGLHYYSCRRMECCKGRPCVCVQGGDRRGCFCRRKQCEYTGTCKD